MIDLELWRARIGLYHAASAGRRSKKLKHSSQGVHMSTTTKWGTKEAVDGIPFALRSCIAAVSLVLVIQCVLTFLKKQKIRKALYSFVEASYRVLKTVLTSGVPLLLKVCVVVIPLLLLLAGDVERNPGPTEGTTVVAEKHVSKLAVLLDEVAGSWEVFVCQLGVPSYVVDQIKCNNAKMPNFAKLCLIAGIRHWVQSDENPTCERIVDIFRGTYLPNRPLATKVEQFSQDLRGKEYFTVKLDVKEVSNDACSIQKTSVKDDINVFVCGCGNCSLFVCDKCPAPTPMTFPTMTKSSLSEERMMELAADTVTIDRKFNSLVSTTLRSFEEQKIPPSGVLHSLMALNSFIPIFKGERRPVVYQLKKELENAESVSDMMWMMKDFFSFFDFHIIEHVIDCCGSGDDKAELQRYKADFNDYLARRIYELPSKLVNHSDKDHAKIVVKLDSEYEEYSGIRLKLFEKMLADILHVSQSVLRLCDIVSGCFELTFETPSFVAEAIFPLSEVQERELAANHVLRLSCGDYHFPHQDCQNDDESPKPPDSDDEGSLAVQVEHVEVVSKGDSPEPSIDDGDSALGTSLHTGDKSTTITDKSTTITIQDIDDTLKVLRQLKERDEADAKRKDKPQLHVLAYFGDIHAMKTMIESQHVDPASVDGYGMTPLHQATLAGHIDIVKYLLNELSCHPACPGNLGRTPLHIAAMYGHLDIVKYLVEEEGLEPLCEDANLCTPLHYCAIQGYMTITKYLANQITKYRSVRVDDLRNCIKFTPFHFAVSFDHLNIVKYLIEEQGCNIMTPCMRGDLPLHMAAGFGCLKVLEYLIEVLGCDPMAVNKEGIVQNVMWDIHVGGRTALQYAAHSGQLNVVKWLIEKHKCNPLIADHSGYTTLHDSASCGSLDVLKYFINKQNCDPMCRSKEGITPLHIAALMGRMDIVKYLTGAKLRCDPNIRDKEGRTPLHCAAQNGHIQLIDFLVSKLRCDPHTANKNGKTALHIAAENGQLNVVRCLIEKHKCPLTEDQLGLTPLHYLASEGHLHVLRDIYLLIDNLKMFANQKGITPLHSAAGGGQIDVVKYLTLEICCDPNVKDEYGHAPLHDAAEKGHLKIVGFLVSDLKCDPNGENNDSKTVLHIAARNGQLDVVKYLIEKHTCIPLVMDRFGLTALHNSAGGGHLDVLKYLIVEQKCDPMYANKQGVTPLHSAAGTGRMDVVTLDLHCDPNIRNKGGHTPLHYAVQFGHANVVKFYIEDLVIPADIRGKQYMVLLNQAKYQRQNRIVKYLQQKLHPNHKNNTCLQM